MMEVEQLTVPKKTVTQELQAFKTLIKSHRKTILQQTHKDLHRIYGHIQKGGTVVDIQSSFKKAGVNENRNPKLAICRADAKICHCYKHPNGSVVYSIERRINNPRKTKGDTFLPKGTFDFAKEDGSTWMNWKERFIQTPVPIIPTSILAPINHSLKNYHTLWEVEKWKPVPPRDPILVKIVTPNIALVLATWNLTELERAVIRGRL